MSYLGSYLLFLRITLTFILLGTWLPLKAESLIPANERRSVEQTYLTYPEWFLVHSPAEYASFVKRHPAHEFPFLAHIGQLWGSYTIITKKQISSQLPVNSRYHVMIIVIASSTTIEYGLRSLYENTIGRASYFLSEEQPTAEEKMGAEIAQEYVDFIRKEPWYLFNFNHALKKLWLDVSIFGSQPIRKIERRYALSTEYLIKALYAKLIKIATNTAYEPAKMTTWAVVSGINSETKMPLNTRVYKHFQNNKDVIIMPRYESFWPAAQLLSKQGVKFEDIAGNSNKILVTILTNKNAKEIYPALFVQPIITVKETERRALEIPVLELAEFLKTSQHIEHIYDF